mmetsp:Transcript_24193/g.57659  ORF Transcript_24193/g.57659 Transcript_24193/m.57659 type:complete len:229 (-) Transcript_24193:850-1536(-)
MVAGMRSASSSWSPTSRSRIVSVSIASAPAASSSAISMRCGATLRSTPRDFCLRKPNSEAFSILLCSVERKELTMRTRKRLRRRSVAVSVQATRKPAPRTLFCLTISSAPLRSPRACRQSIIMTLGSVRYSAIKSPYARKCASAKPTQAATTATPRYRESMRLLNTILMRRVRKGRKRRCLYILMNERNVTNPKSPRQQTMKYVGRSKLTNVCSSGGYASVFANSRAA